MRTRSCEVEDERWRSVESALMHRSGSKFLNVMSLCVVSAFEALIPTQ